MKKIKITYETLIIIIGNGAFVLIFIVQTLCSNSSRVVFSSFLWQPINLLTKTEILTQSHEHRLQKNSEY